MTKREYREAYRLTEREQAQLWNEIRDPDARTGRRTPRWAPWAGGLAAAACAVAIMILATDDTTRGPVTGQTDVAVHSSAAPAAEPPASVPPAETMLDEAPMAGADDLDAARIVPDPEVVGRQTEADVPADGGRPAVDEPAFIREVEMSRARTEKTSRRSAPIELTASTAGVIRGRVTDARSGNPLPGAVVSVEGGHRTALTDGQGRFVLSGLTPGSHRVSVRYLGYAVATRDLTVTAADTMDAVVALESRADDDDEAVIEGLPHPAAVDMAGSMQMREMMVADKSWSGPRERVARLAESVRPSPESGGTANPNDRPYDLVYHQHYGVNPFVPTEEDALSTFAIEVDDASWSIARRYLEDGHRPPAEAVRLEEIVNHLDPGLRHAGDEDFALRVDGAPSRFGEGYQLLRVGVLAREVVASERRPAHLVFVIDISGSMNRENRLGLVKQALGVLVDELQEGDRVGIVVYGREARVVLAPTGSEDRARIREAIAGLRTGGSTNAEAGLELAYAMARRLQQPDTTTRLILCSDGVANVGRTGPDSILEQVRRKADEGITLTTVGFGMGNYNDVLMEQLADQGDGTYHYVQRLSDAERLFRENLTGTLEAMGRETKVQVEFDPEFVTRWRLLGYENRDVADEDFRDDTVDAGDIGAGHKAVALYEIKLTERAARERDQGWSLPLGEVRLRWARPSHHPEAGHVTEIRCRIMSADLATSWSAADAHVRLAAVAAEFAEILRGSYWARGSSLADLAVIAGDLARELDDDDAAELAQMIGRAARIERDGGLDDE
jgi:Ca-activated chloride channel family protein